MNMRYRNTIAAALLALLVGPLAPSVAAEEVVVEGALVRMDKVTRQATVRACIDCRPTVVRITDTTAVRQAGQLLPFTFEAAACALCDVSYDSRSKELYWISPVEVAPPKR